MKEISIIGVDLAKQVFQLHGATMEGEVVFRKKPSRRQSFAFMQSPPRVLLRWKSALRPTIGRAPWLPSGVKCA